MAPSQGLARVDRTAAAGVRIEGFQRLDAGVERAVLALVRAGGAVPTAVGQLLVDQVRHQVVETGRLVPVIAGKSHEDADDAGLRHAPAGLPLPQPLAAAKCGRVPRRQTQPQQVQQRVRRRGPLGRVDAATPMAVAVLNGQQPGSPSVGGNPGPLMGDILVRGVGEIP